MTQNPGAHDPADGGRARWRAAYDAAAAAGRVRDDDFTTLSGVEAPAVIPRVRGPEGNQPSVVVSVLAPMARCRIDVSCTQPGLSM